MRGRQRPPAMNERMGKTIPQRIEKENVERNTTSPGSSCENRSNTNPQYPGMNSLNPGT